MAAAAKHGAGVTGVLSYAQLKGLWLAAAKGTKYDTGAWATLMAAIAEAESGGNPDATNPTDNGGTQTSWGLWQISLGNHQAPASNWADPAENAKLAIGKLQSQGLGAWGTYTSGAYKAYMSGKTSPVAYSGGNPGAISAELTAASATDCLMANPFGVTLPLVGRVGGSGCLFTCSNARAFIGGALLVGGVAVGALGLGVVLAGAGLESKTARRAVELATFGRAGSLPRHTRPGQKLSPGEVEYANANARERAKTAPAQGRHAKPRERNPQTGGGRHAAPAS